MSAAFYMLFKNWMKGGVDAYNFLPMYATVGLLTNSRRNF
jgi:hypothetical protein